ncbi:hypothetical protein [Croceitalea rosinachiae]|uniref:DUF4263 domain-containing protein n=1 Tax=Croceitalea rosinachiae TaxID=3075596 RepID=A0ABU3A7E1_9FLAO|nr:hypothetical protein [Croceitalea sp. F388]MDT0606097.1 hypothetical protein [Croceitalea sp. F388]
MIKTEIHEHLLQFLIEQKVNFLPRQTNRDKKLEKKEWFLNGPDYNCFTFWTGFDGDRKVPKIALFFSLEAPFQLRLVLNSRSDLSALPLLKDIANNLGVDPVQNRKNEWSKILGKSLYDISELQIIIKDFINNERVLIDDLLEKHDHPKIKSVSDEKFIKVISNLNKYRSSYAQLDFSSSDIIGVRKKIGRKGVKSISEEKEIRNILAKRLFVKKKHSRLQNKLFEILSKRHLQSHLIMEENYIDLKFEDENTIIIFEVKPYQSVNRCIKESLGQLMGYYYNLENSSNKKVELIIAGPNQLKGIDKNYLRFLKSILKVKLTYIAI